MYIKIYQVYINNLFGILYCFDIYKHKLRTYSGHSCFAFLHGHVTAILTSREWYASNTWTGVLFQLAVKSRPRPHFDVMFPHPWRVSLLSFLSSSQHMSKYSCQHMSKYSDTLLIKGYYFSMSIFRLIWTKCTPPSVWSAYNPML